MDDMGILREILAGMAACSRGYPCAYGASEAFQRGYGNQYRLEQEMAGERELEYETLRDQ